MRYYGLKKDFPKLKERNRIIGRLINLKKDLDQKIPSKAFKEKKDEIIYGNKTNSAGAYDFYKKVFTIRQFRDYLDLVIKNLKDKLAEQNEKLAKENDMEKRNKIEKSMAKF